MMIKSTTSALSIRQCYLSIQPQAKQLSASQLRSASLHRQRPNIRQFASHGHHSKTWCPIPRFRFSTWNHDHDYFLSFTGRSTEPRGTTLVENCSIRAYRHSEYHNNHCCADGRGLSSHGKPWVVASAIASSAAAAPLQSSLQLQQRRMIQIYSGLLPQSHQQRLRQTAQKILLLRRSTGHGNNPQNEEHDELTVRIQNVIAILQQQRPDGKIHLQPFESNHDENDSIQTVDSQLSVDSPSTTKSITANSSTYYNPATLNVNHCFDLLEACMEKAQTNRDIHAAHQARALLQAMMQRRRRNDSYGLGDPIKASNDSNTAILNVKDIVSSEPEISSEISNVNADALDSSHEVTNSIRKDKDDDHHQQHQINQYALFPTTPFYDVVLHSYAICHGGKPAAMAAQTILEQMLSDCRQYQKQQIIQAATSSNHTGKTTRVDWSESRPPPPPPPPPEPTAKTFNIVIHAWAQSRHFEAGQRAEALVQIMQEWNRECQHHAQVFQQKEQASVDDVKSTSYPKHQPYQNFSYKGVTPNERTLVALVDAWSKSRHSQAAERAMKILAGAIKEAQSGSIQLDPALFHVVLGTLVRQSQRAKTGRRAGERAEEMLSLMEKCSHFFDYGQNLRPGIRAYALVLEVWMRCEQVEQNGKAAQRAEFLLRSLIDTFRRRHGAQAIKPNKRCFTTCIAAWSRAKLQKDAPERAEALLNMMVELYQETKDEDFRPDVGLFNAVLAAWTRATDRPDSMERAKACLQSLRDFTDPNLVSFNTILDGMGKRGMGKAAMELVDWLEGVGQKIPAILPDRITYNCALTAVSRDTSYSDRQQAWDESLTLLDRMRSLNAESSRRDLIPDPVSYTIALGSWLHRSRNDSAAKTGITVDQAAQAYDLVEDLVKKCQSNFPVHTSNADDDDQNGAVVIKPDIPIFTSFMQVCGQVKCENSSERDRALQMVLNAMERCTSGAYGEVNHVAYAYCMKAINHLCPDHEEQEDGEFANPSSKQATLFRLFKQCAEGGHVSKQVLQSMHIGVWNKRMDKTTNQDDNGGSNYTKPPTLQSSWSRNVPHRSRPKIETVAQL